MELFLTQFTTLDGVIQPPRGLRGATAPPATAKSASTSRKTDLRRIRPRTTAVTSSTLQPTILTDAPIRDKGSTANQRNQRRFRSPGAIGTQPIVTVSPLASVSTRVTEGCSAAQSVSNAATAGARVPASACRSSNSAHRSCRLRGATERDSHRLHDERRTEQNGSTQQKIDPQRRGKSHE
jgi:hypothetical protein